MSKVNISKNVGHTSKAFKTKSISNSSYTLLPVVSMASLLAMWMLYLTPSVDAHVQTTYQSFTSNNTPIEGKATA